MTYTEALELVGADKPVEYGAITYRGITRIIICLEGENGRPRMYNFMLPEVAPRKKIVMVELLDVGGHSVTVAPVSDVTLSDKTLPPLPHMSRSEIDRKLLMIKEFGIRKNA